MTDSKRQSTGASRARVQSLVEDLERGIVTRNARAVLAGVSALRTEILERAPVAAVEEGGLHAMLGTLNYASRDEGIIDIVVQTVAALGKRVSLSSSNKGIPIAVLLRHEGISLVLKVAKEHKTSRKISEGMVRILANCAVDELGARLIIYADASSYLMDILRRYPSETSILAFALIALANMCLFHLSARASILATDRESLALLIAISKQHKNEPEVLEQVFCILCMISTGLTGANSLLKFRTEIIGAIENDVVSFPDVVPLALDVITRFAMRTFEQSVNETRANAMMVDSPFNALKTGLQRFAATTPTNQPLSSPVKPASGVVSVVTSHERRLGAWVLMLLHNLALQSSESHLKRFILQELSSNGEQDVRDLHREVVERLRYSVSESSENVQEDDFIESTEPVDAIACPGDDLQDGSVMSVLSNLFSLHSNGASGQSITPEQLLMQISSALQKEMTVKSFTKYTFPVTPSSSRLLTFVFAMFSHPYSREKLGADVFEIVSLSVLDVLRNSRFPEYYSPIAKALEAAIGTRESSPPLIPYRSVQAMLELSPIVASVGPQASPQAALGPGGMVISATPTKTRLASVISQTSTPQQQQTPSSIASSGKTPTGYPEGEFSLFDWRNSPKELCRQLTLRMERLYAAVNPLLLGLGNVDIALAEAESSSSTNPTLLSSAERDVGRFLAFHSSLVQFFKSEILARSEPRDRAGLLECITDIASIAARGGISNIDLTIACLEALTSPPISRLEISWRKVRVDALQVLEELLRISHFDDLDDLVQGPPPPFYRDAGVPYLWGCLRALYHHQQQVAPRKSNPGLPNHEEVSRPTTTMSVKERWSLRYTCLHWWLPRMGKNGDWHFKAQMFIPIPSVQMVLSRLVIESPSPVRYLNPLPGPTTNGSPKQRVQQNGENDQNLISVDDTSLASGVLSPSSSPPPPPYSFTPVNHSNSNIDTPRSGFTDEELMQLSLALEPVWALEHAKVEESVTVQLQVERILAEDNSLEASAILSLRREAFDVSVSDRYGKMCKRLTAELLKRDEFKIHRKRYEPIIRGCVERVVLAPVMARLFVLAMDVVKQHETQLIVNSDQLRILGFERMCELLGVPFHLRLPWHAAVVALNAWIDSGVAVLPSTALQNILLVKDAIFEEAKTRSNIKEMNADDLLPVLSLIIAQSRCKTLCATCHFLHTFYGDELASGEAAYYLITLESAIQQLRLAL